MATESNEQVFNTAECCSLFPSAKDGNIRTFPPDPKFSIGVKHTLESTPFSVRGVACLSTKSELVLGRGFEKIPTEVLESSDRLIFLISENVAPFVDLVESTVKNALRPHNTRHASRLANKPVTILFVVARRTHFSLVRSVVATI